MGFNLRYIGFNYQENNQFIISRPEGSKDYLFLLFTTSVNLIIDGNAITTEPFALILFEPDYPQYYSNQRDGFINDWFHFTSDDFIDLLSTLELPLNRPFYISQIDFVREFVRDLELEFKLKGIAHQEMINAHMTAFFIKLARHYLHEDVYILNPYMASLKDQMIQVRSKVLTSCHETWDLDRMSALVPLSRSRFSVLYKSFFSVSPKEDLIRERFNMAKHLLQNTQLTVQEIATKVGYDNLYHFSKQFKKETGLTPGGYRATPEPVKHKASTD